MDLPTVALGPTQLPSSVKTTAPGAIRIIVEKNVIFDHQRLRQVVDGAASISVIAFNPAATQRQFPAPDPSLPIKVESSIVVMEP